MGFIVVALGVHPAFPLVVAANRDEFFGRPASPLHL
ncbi:MAG: NRDE family protein [Proteobacteria bacterium]|nr:NRDE family protein [Pseudomonadota bacterium]